MSTSFSNCKHIGIVGAGPAGLAALHTITLTPQCESGVWTVKCFEARDDIGGIWYVTQLYNTAGY